MRRALLEVEAALGKGDRLPAPSSMRSTIPQGRKWPVPRRSAALGALDVSTAVIMLVLSIRCLDAGASTVTRSPSQVDASPPATAVLAMPAPEASSTVRPRAAAPPAEHAVVSPQPAVTPTATSHVDSVTAHRNIYDRRN